MSSSIAQPPKSFRVTLKHLRVSDQDLLADLKQVATKLNTRRLSMGQYVKHGRFDVQRMCRRFGSWTSALAIVKLKPFRPLKLNREILLADIRRVATRLGVDQLSLDAYRRHGNHSSSAMQNHLGLWSLAVEQAGLMPLRRRARSKPELFQNLEQAWVFLGHQPLRHQLHRPASRYGIGAYTRLFGDWNTALAAFARWKGQTIADPADQIRIRVRRRSVDTTLRYAVLNRDHFRCQACGASPATDPSVQLQVDHKIPLSRGGQTVLENLQTLCQKCNRGKWDTPSGEESQTCIAPDGE